jgi:penicillin-binding protein 1B
VKRIRSLVRRLCTWRALGVVLVAIGTTALASRSFDARVARGFEAAESRSPTRVYGRPLVIRAGDDVPARRLRDQLERNGYTATSSRSPGIGQFRFRDREWIIGRRPLRIGAFFDQGGVTTVRLDWSGRIRDITDAAGERLAGIVVDPEQVAALRGPDGRDRIPVRLEEVPEHLIAAILIAEDRRFLSHSGLDPRRIAGALVANVRERRLAQGGSTITQQLARTLFLSRDRKVMRKLREVALAFSLEREFPKERLLAAYLNHIYLGQSGGAAIHGVGRAAEFFFDKDVTELTVDESAMIAGIIRGPSVYSPHRHPERARARRDLVLQLMQSEGRLGEAEFERALAADLRIAQPPRPQGDGGWYFDYLERELAAAAAGNGAGAGLTVISTIEPAIQRTAEDVVARQLERLERLRPRLAQQPQSLQAALVALDPWTGEVIAMVGGRSYGESQFNRATEARRQPGSSFKPIVALAALEDRDGHGYTLASTLDDEPLDYQTPNGVWSPSNADRDFMGPISLRTALEESRNVPFARLGIQVGPERIVETARRLGVRSPLAPYPALALGASEVTLLELTGAYAVLAAEGQRTAPHAVRSALDRNGDRVGDVGMATTTEEFSPALTYLVTSALRGVVENGTGSAVRDLGYRGPVAAKSGTTNGSRDAWFVGYTPEMVVGVWVGFDDGTPVGLTGSQAALPIFTDFLRTTLGADGGAEFRIPVGLERQEVPTSDGRAFGCNGDSEIFLTGTAPRNVCNDWERRWRSTLGDRGRPRRSSGRGR